jgi:hypothetical protein
METSIRTWYPLADSPWPIFMRLRRFSLVPGILWIAGVGFSQTATNTTLAVTSGGSAVATVKEGTPVTLTATVTAGSSPVTRGLVEFCDAAPPHCSDIHLMGTAQLTASGTAVVSFYPAAGTHTYHAVFVGTHVAGTSSASAALNVLASIPTVTDITSVITAIAPGTYSFAVGVTGTAGTIAPTGTVSILDTSNGNYVLGTATLKLGSGSGGGSSSAGFGTPIVSAPANGPLAVGDFNGDGKKDLAVGATPGSQVTLLLGQNNGRFTVGSTSTSGTTPISIAAGDFNGDGKLDIAVVNYGNYFEPPSTSPDAYFFIAPTAEDPLTPGSVTILLGHGDGTFAAAQTLPSSANPYPSSIATGDFNGDGIPDLAITNAYEGVTPAIATVNILLGNGDGTFTLKSTNPTGSHPASVVVGDFNRDGIQDLAVANAFDDTVMILLGKGDGTFTALAPFYTGPWPNPLALAVADFNGDGIPDLAVAEYGPAALRAYSPSGGMMVLLGNGDGTFTLSEEFDARNHVNSIAVGDFNADGNADIVVSDFQGAAQVYFGDGTGNFQLPELITPNGAPVAVAAADFNGDGVTDIATASGNLNVLPAQLGSSGTSTATATVNNFFIVGTGVHQVVASYSGDNNYSGSTSGTQGLTAAQQPTTLAFTANPATSNYAQPVTLTAVVAPNAAQNHNPGGTMTFTDGSTLVGTAPVVNGTATFATTMLTSGANTLTATYSGDANFASSTATAMETVNGSGSVTTLTVAPDPVLVGQPVTLSVGVVGISYATTPTGSVTFYNGTVSLAKLTLDATGHAAYTLTALPVGSYALTAVYSGDALFYTSTSPVATLVVSAYASTTTLAVTPNPAATGQPVTLTAAVTGVASAIVPTGAATFYDLTTALGTVTLDATGHATLTTASLALGSDNLTAVYAGNAMYSGSTSAVVTEVVQPPTFTITLSSPSITLATYQHTTTAVMLTSQGNFNDTVTMACGNVPKFVTCIFQPSPAALVVNGTVTVSFYLDTDSILGGDGKSGPIASSRAQAVSAVRLAFLLAPLGLLIAGRRRRGVKLVVLLAAAAIPLALSGCGVNVITPVPSAAPGVYGIPVTATGSNSGIAHAAQLTLTVTP